LGGAVQAAQTSTLVDKEVVRVDAKPADVKEPVSGIFDEASKAIESDHCDVTLEFDAGVWQSAGLYLLAAVLARFLALHATVNSFVRTSAVLRGRPGRAAAWPARAGVRVLL